jgi:hypothetical protein
MAIEKSVKFIQVEPMEYQPKRIVRFRNIIISKRLNQPELDRIIKETKMRKKATSQTNPSEFLFYQYEDKPLIAYDLKDNNFYTTKGTLEHYGMMKCQVQAAILLKLLKKYNLARFRYVTLSLYRTGRTLEDIELTFKGIKNLLERNKHE